MIQNTKYISTQKLLLKINSQKVREKKKEDQNIIFCKNNEEIFFKIRSIDILSQPLFNVFLDISEDLDFENEMQYENWKNDHIVSIC